jgi:hypothetical protein
MANATVSVRYAVDDHWICIKGSSMRGKSGIPMPKQYLAHAKALVADPNFGQLPSCWGDGRITQIAKAQIRSGSRPMWVQLSANRHLSLIANRLP